jgi:CheY-like chemotaxis protein
MAPVVPQVPLVLVVDDSITVRRVTQRLLQREGYRVSLAADGLQALERLQEELPAVVLSDIEMPRMDGFDLARNIRADVRLAHLPIIMITSRIAEKHREHAKDAGREPLPGQAVLGRRAAEPGEALLRGRRRSRPERCGASRQSTRGRKAPFFCGGATFGRDSRRPLPVRDSGLPYDFFTTA